jgi:hypothetical protein
MISAVAVANLEAQFGSLLLDLLEFSGRGIDLLMEKQATDQVKTLTGVVS